MNQLLGTQHGRDAAAPVTTHERLMEMLLSLAPVGLGLVDRDLRRVWVNEALARFNGLTIDDHVGRTVPDLMPTLWPQLEPYYRRVLDHGEAVLDVEVSGAAEVGSDIVRTWRMSYYPVTLDGAVVGVGIVANDITELKNSMQQQRHLASIVEKSGDAIFSSTLDGVATSWNEAAERLFGYTAAEILGQPLALLALGGNEWSQADIRARIAATGQALRTETVRRRKDGSLVDVLITASPTTDDHGGVVGLSVIVQDITERLEAERIRREAEVRFEVAFEQAGIGAAILGLDGVRTRVNAAACTILGRPREELINRSWDEFHHPDEVGVAQAMRARHIDDSSAGTYSDERRYFRPDGSIVWVLMNLSLVRDDAGQPQYYLAQLQDITERKAVEAELAHMALHDTLTGLANRALLTDRLNHGIGPDPPSRQPPGRHLPGPRPVQDRQRLPRARRGRRTAAPRCHPDQTCGARDRHRRPVRRRRVRDRLRRLDGRGGRAGRHPDPAGDRRAVLHRRRGTDRQRQHRDRVRRHRRQPPTACCATPTPRCTRPRNAGATASRCSMRCFGSTPRRGWRPPPRFAGH